MSNDQPFFVPMDSKDAVPAIPPPAPQGLDNASQVQENDHAVPLPLGISAPQSVEPPMRASDGNMAAPVGVPTAPTVQSSLTRSPNTLVSTSRAPQMGAPKIINGAETPSITTSTTPVAAEAPTLRSTNPTQATQSVGVAGAQLVPPSQHSAPTAAPMSQPLNGAQTLNPVNNMNQG